MHSIESLLKETIKKLDDELMATFRLIPSYPVMIAEIENGILNLSKPLSATPEEIFLEHILDIFEKIVIDEIHEDEDRDYIASFSILTFGEEDLDEAEQSLRFGSGLYLLQALYNLKSAKDELKNGDYSSAFDLYSAAHYSNGVIYGFELGHTDGSRATRQISSSKARRTKQKMADERREKIKHLYFEFKNNNPKISKNLASRKIAKKVALSPEVVRRHLIKI